MHDRRLRTALVIVVVAVGCSVAWWNAAAKKTGASTAQCKAGKPCVCNQIGACVRTCAGPGCEFECHSTGSCTFVCPKGKCNATSDATGSTTLSCAGNGCNLTCSGTGTCTLAGCKKDCKLTCSGVGVCTNTCKDPSCS
jgi:hypothetical protein